jgi:hypothetical protein
MKLTIKITSILTITLMMFLWLINLWITSLWQQNIQAKSLKSPPQMQIEIPPKKQIALSFIALPAVPQKTLVKEEDNKGNEGANNKGRIISVKTPITKPVKSKESNIVSTANMYQKLVTDNSINVEIAWPHNSTDREKLFNYLYQCAGMKFGVLQQQRVTLVKDYHHQPHSEWLRVAQGKLAKREYKWMRQYQLSGTAVRLFPKKIDWQLANIIAQQLNGKTLNSFRANYRLNHHSLQLENVYLNDEKNDANWLLMQTPCNVL